MHPLIASTVSMGPLTMKFGDPLAPMTAVDIVLTLLIMVGFLYLLYRTGRWAHRDALARGCSGGWVVFLVVFVNFPLGLVIWLGARPPLRLSPEGEARQRLR